MKKILVLIITLMALSIGYFMLSYSNSTQLKGSYKSSNPDNKNIVLITVDPEDNTFVQYIDQRKVDEGSVMENSDKSYTFKGSKQEFDITLNGDNSFDIFIEKINGSEPIKLKNITEHGTYYSTDFGDEEEYKKLLP